MSLPSSAAGGRAKAAAVCSRPPHLAEAIGEVALQALVQGLPATLKATPLHCACNSETWDAALALLAAGARVDIAGWIDGRLQTMAEWARSPACEHRGLILRLLRERGSTRRRQKLPQRRCHPAALDPSQVARQLLPPPPWQQKIQVTVQRRPQQRQQPGMGSERGSSRRVARAAEGRRTTAQRSCRWTTKQRR